MINAAARPAAAELSATQALVVSPHQVLSSCLHSWRRESEAH
jgi:hypothetical protein